MPEVETKLEVPDGILIDDNFDEIFDRTPVTASIGDSTAMIGMAKDVRKEGDELIATISVHEEYAEMIESDMLACDVAIAIGSIHAGGFDIDG